MAKLDIYDNLFVICQTNDVKIIDHEFRNIVNAFESLGI